MSALARTTLDTLRDDFGISRAQWVARFGHEGQWHGDRCGCPDDRCIGYHHAEDAECGCVQVLAEEVQAASAIAQ